MTMSLLDPCMPMSVPAGSPHACVRARWIHTCTHSLIGYACMHTLGPCMVACTRSPHLLTRRVPHPAWSPCMHTPGLGPHSCLLAGPILHANTGSLRPLACRVPHAHLVSMHICTRSLCSLTHGVPMHWAMHACLHWALMPAWSPCMDALGPCTHTCTGPPCAHTCTGPPCADAPQAWQHMNVHPIRT